MADVSRVALVDTETNMLAEILHAVVHAGAGVSFFTPFSVAEARAFWIEQSLAPGACRGASSFVGAVASAKIASSAQCNSTARCRRINNTGRRWPSCWFIRTSGAAEIRQLSDDRYGRDRAGRRENLAHPRHSDREQSRIPLPIAWLCHGGGSFLAMLASSLTLRTTGVPFDGSSASSPRRRSGRALIRGLVRPVVVCRSKGAGLVGKFVTAHGESWPCATPTDLCRQRGVVGNAGCHEWRRAL